MWFCDGRRWMKLLNPLQMMKISINKQAFLFRLCLHSICIFFQSSIYKCFIKQLFCTKLRSVHLKRLSAFFLHNLKQVEYICDSNSLLNEILWIKVQSIFLLYILVHNTCCLFSSLFSSKHGFVFACCRRWSASVMGTRHIQAICVSLFTIRCVSTWYWHKNAMYPWAQLVPVLLWGLKNHKIDL